MKTDLEIQLKNDLTLTLKQIKEARIDGMFRKDFQIIRVDLIQPIITSPDDLPKDDFKNAKEIRFEKGRIKISEQNANGLIDNMYYVDGTAVIDYLNGVFQVDLNISNIYRN